MTFVKSDKLHVHLYSGEKGDMVPLCSFGIDGNENRESDMYFQIPGGKSVLINKFTAICWIQGLLEIVKTSESPAYRK